MRMGFNIQCHVQNCNWINSHAKRATNLFHNLQCNVLDFPFHFIPLSVVYKFTAVIFSRVLFLMHGAVQPCRPLYFAEFFLRSKFDAEMYTFHSVVYSRNSIIQYRWMLKPQSNYTLNTEHPQCAVISVARILRTQWANIVNYGYAAVFHILYS